MRRRAGAAVAAVVLCIVWVLLHEHCELTALETMPSSALPECLQHDFRLRYSVSQAMRAAGFMRINYSLC